MERGDGGVSAAVPVVHFSRRYRFSASHRLHVPSLSDEQNRETYGRCNNPFGHGHNYTVQVTVAGPVDEQTGFVVDLPALDALVRRELIDRFDSTHLNADPIFAGAFVPSTEHFVAEADRVLRKAVELLDKNGKLRLANIRVEETGNNSFDLCAEPYSVPHPDLTTGA